MTSAKATLANVRAGRYAMFLPAEAVYAEAMRRLAMDPTTPQPWLDRAIGASENLAAATPGQRADATAEYLAKARELFEEP